MEKFVDYSVVVICSIALIISLLQLTKTAFNPKWMVHPVFEFPKDRLRRSALLLCGMLVLTMLIMLKLGMLEKC
jgi:hypothetical protein